MNDKDTGTKKRRVATNVLFRFKIEQPERFGVFLTYLQTMMDTCTFCVINAQDPNHQQDQVTSTRLRHDKDTSADFSGFYVECLDKHMVALVIAKFQMTVLDTIQCDAKIQFTLDLSLLSKMVKSLTTDQQMEVYVKEDTKDQLVHFDVFSLTQPHFRRTMYISMLDFTPDNSLTIEDETYTLTVHMPMASFQGVMKTCDALQALWVKLYILKQEDHAVLVFQLLGEGQHAYSEHCFLMTKDQGDYTVQETTLVGKEDKHKTPQALEIIFADNFPVKYLKSFGNTTKITFRLHPQKPIIILQKILRKDDQSSICAIVPPTAEDLQDHPLVNFPGSYQA